MSSFLSLEPLTVPPDQQLTVGTISIFMESKSIQQLFQTASFFIFTPQIRVSLLQLFLLCLKPPVVMQVRLYFIDKGIKSLLWSQ